MTIGRFTKPLKVKIQEKVSDLSFVILPQENIEIIFELDWLTVHNAITNPKERVIEFKEDKRKNDCLTTEEIVLLAELHEDDMLEAIDWPETNFDFDLPDHFTEHQKKKFREFLIINRDRFATSLLELGACNLKKLTIKTTTEKPIYQHPYRKSERERLAIKQEIVKMFKKKIIQYAKSPWFTSTDDTKEKWLVQILD